MIEHRPGNWNTTKDKVAALRKIDEAINQIKMTSIDYRKNLEDHPKVDEIKERRGFLEKAFEWLRWAWGGFEKDEDNCLANVLKKRTFFPIDEAMGLTQKASEGLK